VIAPRSPNTMKETSGSAPLRWIGYCTLSFRAIVFDQRRGEIAAWKAWAFTAWLGLVSGYYWGRMIGLW